MEYISSFTYCDSIQTEFTPHGPCHHIMNPLQVIAPIAIPGNYSFAIACTVAGFDALKENCIEIKFFDTKEQMIYGTGEVKFQVPEEQIKPDNSNTMQFNLDIRNLVFKEKGLYSTKIFLNRKQIGDYKIQVIVGDIQ